MVPSRAVKCQICSWQGTRTYGAIGILAEPCPAGHRCTYAIIHPDDSPVLADSGTIRAVSQKRTMSPQHKAKILVALAMARAGRAQK
jgi:hypothetical protein